jgi:flagellar motility protein MotE (MotC chaperone)
MGASGFAIEAHMADEKKDEKIESKDGKGEPSAKPAAGMKAVILVCLGVFLVATAGFAWMEGLFGPAPAVPLALVAETAVDSTTPSVEAPAQVSPEHETLAQAASRPASNTLAQESAHPGQSTDAPTAPSSRESEEWLNNEKAQLAQRRAEVDQKTKELERLKSEIEQLLARVQETKSERIVMMAKLYDSMDPEAVARQISSMDDRTVVLLLPQMNTRTAAKVMAAIDPKRAAQITTKMLALEP